MSRTGPAAELQARHQQHRCCAYQQLLQRACYALGPLYQSLECACNAFWVGTTLQNVLHTTSLNSDPHSNFMLNTM